MRGHGLTCTPLAATTKPMAERSVAFSLAAILRLWLRRRRERQQLAAMGSLAWRDLGLSDIDVLHEIRKPFWRP